MAPEQEKPSNPKTPPPNSVVKPSIAFEILTSFHAGYFRISLSLSSQSLLFKTLIHTITTNTTTTTTTTTTTSPFIIIPNKYALSFQVIIWSLSLLSLLLLWSLFLLRCALRPRSLASELSHPIGMNYLFAPFASSLLLLQSAPFNFIPSNSTSYLLLSTLLSIPILCLDLKIYGRWFAGRNNFLSIAANPTTQVGVIGNLVGARAAAEMGWREAGICMFAVGIAHYIVVFVTLYQRLVDGSLLPAMLRPAFFLMFATPSMASIAWESIAGQFDVSCRMLFFLSLFLFATLVSRPKLFKRSMKKFDIAWWAYSFPLTVLALAATEYTQEVKLWLPNVLMVVLTIISVTVTITLLVFTAIRPNDLLPENDPFQSPSTESNLLPQRLPL